MSVVNDLKLLILWISANGAAVLSWTVRFDSAQPTVDFYSEALELRVALSASEMTRTSSGRLLAR